MALVPYTITAIERDVADAAASGKQVVVGAVCSLFLQPSDVAAQLYDNAAGDNGSTAKVTNSSGQVTVWVEAGDYRVSVNGNDSFISLQTGGETVTASVTETQTLAAAQTTVTLASLSTTNTAFYINGPSVDNGRLVLGVDFTLTSTATIELTTAYADGTLITAVQNDGTEALFTAVKVFDNIAEMKADASLVANDYAICKRYYSGGDLVDGLNFNVVATATVDGFIDHENVNGTFCLLVRGTELSIEAAGGRENTDSSLALRAVISAGLTLILPAKRYLYDRVSITANAKVVGEKMPQINSGYTSLENGSILQGSIFFSGENVHLENFGCDLGTSTGESNGDGIKARFATLNSGGHLHTENLIALLPSPSTPNHALLFESYQKHTGGNLTGSHGFFGLVNKCQNVNLTSLFTLRNQSDGVYLKSDATDGKCSNVNIGSVIVDGNASQTFGLRLQSDGDSIENINISKVIIDGCARPYKADLNGTLGTSIKNVHIDSMITKNATSRDVHIENGKASASFIYNHKIQKLTCIDTLLEAYNVGGVGVASFINVGDMFISYAPGVSEAQMNAGAVQIGANVLKTQMDKIAIVNNYSFSTTGGVTYNNQSSNNQLGMIIGKVRGSGAPLSGDSSQLLSGVSAQLVVPNPAWNSKQCNARVTISADVTVTSFTESRDAGTGALFETGTVLTIINNSGFNLTINQNFGGNILNRGGTPYILAGNETAAYVYGGAAWHQI